MPKSKNFHYIGNCVNFRGEDIQEMRYHPLDREITRETFLQHVDYETTMKDIEAELGYGSWLHMASDYAVSYFRSKFKGATCYYFTWSAFEYIFIDEKDINLKGHVSPAKVKRCSCGGRSFHHEWVGKSLPKHDEDPMHRVYTCDRCGSRLEAK